MSARDWRLTRAERRVERAGVGRCPRTTASVQGSNQGDRLELSAYNWIGLSPQRAQFHSKPRISVGRSSIDRHVWHPRGSTGSRFPAPGTLE